MSIPIAMGAAGALMLVFGCLGMLGFSGAYNRPTTRIEHVASFTAMLGAVVIFGAFALSLILEP